MRGCKRLRVAQAVHLGLDWRLGLTEVRACELVCKAPCDSHTKGVEFGHALRACGGGVRPRRKLPRRHLVLRLSNKPLPVRIAFNAETVIVFACRIEELAQRVEQPCGFAPRLFNHALEVPEAANPGKGVECAVDDIEIADAGKRSVAKNALEHLGQRQVSLLYAS